MCPPPDDSGFRLATHPSPSLPAEFSREERVLLLRLAHESILAMLEAREISLIPPTSHLAEPRGAFTTIYIRGKLRGCVGYVAPVAPLYRTIAESARGAAFDDTRFAPVSLKEALELEVSLSILSRLEPIQPERVEIGRHGLVISLGGNRGLLLPQVPVEHNWDRTAFLEQTCKKAGLPANAWQAGARLEAFTTEAFSDRTVA
jgi:AmmeMemoRadiSam system protein A